MSEVSLPGADKGVAKQAPQYHHDEYAKALLHQSASWRLPRLCGYGMR